MKNYSQPYPVHFVSKLTHPAYLFYPPSYLGYIGWVTSQLGDKPTGRQSTGRQTNRATTNWATTFGQLGDKLLNYFFAFIVAN